MNETRMNEVAADEVFVKELLQLETPLEVQEALKGKRIDMTESEIIELRDEIVRLAEKVQNGEELSLDQLDEAAGGVVGVTLTGGLVLATAIIAVVGAGGAAISTGLGFGLGAIIGSLRW